MLLCEALTSDLARHLIMNPRGINDEAEDPRGWIHGDESAKTMLARLLAERSLLLLPPLHRLPLRVGNVVEITGPSSSAKSQVLLQVLSYQ